MKKILFIAFLIVSGQVYSASTDDIKKALAKYCIPNPEEQPNACKTELEGQYNKNATSDLNRCRCFQPVASIDSRIKPASMAYSEALRKCDVVCPSGTRARTPATFPKNFSGNCPGGYRERRITTTNEIK